MSEDAKFDVLIIDEGQDFRDDGDKLSLLDTLAKGGLAKGRWRWFEDLNQILTPTATETPSSSLCEFTDTLDDAREYKLVGNLLNTSQIASRVSEAIGFAYDSNTLALDGPEVDVAPLVPGRAYDVLDDLVRKYLAPDIEARRYSA